MIADFLGRLEEALEEERGRSRKKESEFFDCLNEAKRENALLKTSLNSLQQTHMVLFIE